MRHQQCISGAGRKLHFASYPICTLGSFAKPARTIARSTPKSNIGYCGCAKPKRAQMSDDNEARRERQRDGAQCRLFFARGIDAQKVFNAIRNSQKAFANQ
jgi:hypothetical protein